MWRKSKPEIRHVIVSALVKAEIYAPKSYLTHNVAKVQKHGSDMGRDALLC